jgi:hypothetical protein
MPSGVTDRVVLRPTALSNVVLLCHRTSAFDRHDGDVGRYLGCSRTPSRASRGNGGSVSPIRSCRVRSTKPSPGTAVHRRLNMQCRLRAFSLTRDTSADTQTRRSRNSALVWRGYGQSTHSMRVDSRAADPLARQSVRRPWPRLIREWRSSVRLARARDLPATPRRSCVIRRAAVAPLRGGSA